MRRSPAVLLCLLTLAGCGSKQTPTTPTTPQLTLQRAHPCPTDPNAAGYYMQCAAVEHAPRLGLGPHTVAPRPGSTFTLGALFGIDFAWGGPPASIALRDGAKFGASYLSGTSKDWSSALARSYHAAGLGVVFVFETYANRSISGCAGGSADARFADQEVSNLGFASAPVFFAVDFDSTGYSSGGVITQYFRCAAGVLGYARTGSYGGLNTIRITVDNGTVKYGWQTLAWSYGVWDSRACLRQYSINNTFAGYSVDDNSAVCADYGQYAYKPPPPPDPFLLFPDVRIDTPFGVLRERHQVEDYVGARAHPVKYRAYLTGTLEPRLRYLAARVAFLACHGKNLGLFNLPCDWKSNRFGSRYQYLSKAARGQTISVTS